MSNSYFAKEILKEKIQNMLDTKISFLQFLHVDSSLAAQPGMKVEIHKYTATDNIADVAEGQGNNNYSECSYTSEEYTVGYAQGRFKYTDESYLKNPILLDTLAKGQAENMVNFVKDEALREMKKATKIVECDYSSSSTNYFFNKVVDALALVDAAIEDESGFVLLISPNNQAYIRKQLGAQLIYATDSYIKTGYIGSVCGVPVVMSKAVPDSASFLVNSQAITYFQKKGVEVENYRIPNTRENEVYIRKCGVVALTDANYIVELAKAQSTACAITTYLKTGATIAGTCGTDVEYVIVKYDGQEYKAPASAGSWTIDMAANLTSGKKIDASAYAPGYAPKAATQVTVA